jgi:hypothetical protein
MKKTNKNMLKNGRYALVLAALCLCMACPQPDTTRPGSTTVTFNTLTANGSLSQTTTALTLSFSREIAGLSAADISLASGGTGAVKGALNRTGTGVYSLALSGIHAAGSVTVTLNKSGWAFNPDSRTTDIYYNTPQNVSFNDLSANGSSSQTTTSLNLNFDMDIDGLSADDISLSAGGTGALKGALFQNGGGAYTLELFGISAAGSVTVTPNKSGYVFSPASQTRAIYYNVSQNVPQNVSFSGLSADGSSAQTTASLSLNFDMDIDGLSAGDISLYAGSTGAIKGALSRTGTGAYSLALDGIAKSGSIGITVYKSGYDISPAYRTAQVYYYTENVEFSLQANGGYYTASTTVLYLSFTKDNTDEYTDIPGLGVDDITLDDYYSETGAVKGELTRIDTGRYELRVSGISAEGTVVITVNKSGYTFNNDWSPYVTVYYCQPTDITISFTGGQDETIDLSGLPENTLSWTANTALTLSVPGNWESYQWYLDGVPLEAVTNTLTLRARDCSLKTHQLLVVVYKRHVPYPGTFPDYVLLVPYSKTAVFTVGL